MKYLWYCISYDSKSEFILLGRDIKTVLWVVGHEWERQWLNFHLEYPRGKDAYAPPTALEFTQQNPMNSALNHKKKKDTHNKNTWAVLFCDIIVFHGFFCPEWL